MSDVLDGEISDVRCIYSIDSESVEIFNAFFISFLEAEYTQDICDILQAGDDSMHYGMCRLLAK